MQLYWVYKQTSSTVGKSEVLGITVNLSPLSMKEICTTSSETNVMVEIHLENFKG